MTPDGERIGPARPGKGRGGLGLYNVDQKWKLHFGDAGELRIRSEPGKGTEIEMIWPWMKGEEIREGQREKKSADRG